MNGPGPFEGSKACPVDFDHHGPAHAANWPAEFAAMREQCPRAWSEHHGGFWVATRYEDVVGIAQAPKDFTADKRFDEASGGFVGGVSIPLIPSVRGIPNETESPEWDGARGFINRRFAPRAVEAHRERAKQFAAALIDEVIETGSFDIVEDLTNPLPALVTMDLFGFPLDEWRAFADPFHKVVYTPRDHPHYDELVRGLGYFHQRVLEVVNDRRKNPKDDLLGYMAAGTIDGKPLEDEYIQNFAFNILAGGVDTTTSLTSNTLLHLSRAPEDRARLIADPSLLPIAREEFVRYFTPIHGLGRNATGDVEMNGWKFDKGDRVYLAYASANRDPAAFDDPETLDIARFPNKHIGFGAGMHRCLGSFLARLMFEVMIGEVLARIPDYKVIEDEIVGYPTVGLVNGYIHLPATFTPGRKVGATIS
jgi:cytochrome P450